MMTQDNSHPGQGKGDGAGFSRFHHPTQMKTNELFLEFSIYFFFKLKWGLQVTETTESNTRIRGD